jgi:hypothetical protein
MNILTKATVFIIFLVFFGGSDICAQESEKKNIAELSKQIKLGNNALNSGNYAKALHFFTSAELIAENNNLDSYLLIVKFNIGKVYGEIHSPGDALKYYNDAYDIVLENPEFEETGLTIMNNIANLYMDEGDNLMALEYYEKVYAKAKKINSVYNIVLAAINISDVNNKLGNHPLARTYLDKIKDLKMDNIAAQTWKINYAESYFKEGRLKEAEAIMRSVWSNVGNNNDNNCFLCVVKLLAEISSAKGNAEEAVNYAKYGLKKSRSVKDQAEMYELLSDIYSNDRQFNKAYVYKDSLLMVNDSLSKTRQSSLFATNKVRLKIQDYQNEARHNKEKRETERNLFILIIGLGIVLFYFIYRSLKNRIIKQNQENIIAENKQKIYELELDKLSNDIAEKNRKLSAKALYLSGRNELIEEVINALDQIPEIQQASVHNHIKTLKQHLKADEEWDDFISYFEEVNPNFLKLLQIKHPQLNETDVRFICYLYMNLDLKEISSILNITIEAARKRKQRIAKKMDTEIDQLNDYILKLN